MTLVQQLLFWLVTLLVFGMVVIVAHDTIKKDYFLAGASGLAVNKLNGGVR